MALLIAVAVAGCDSITGGGSSLKEGYQGIVEFDEHVLGFEVAGRVASVAVDRGAEVAAGAVIAALDATLESTRREALSEEAEAARLQVDLLRSGERGSKIRALAAELRGARVTEEQLKSSLVRERDLLSRGVSTNERVDNLRFQLDKAAANRQGLAEQLQLLREGARSQEIASAEARSNALAIQVRMQEERIQRFELHTVTSGTILDVHVKPGTVVAPGSPVATLADVGHPYAEVFVPQAQLAGIQMNVPAVVRVDSLAEPLSGRVEYIEKRTEFTPRFIFSEKDRSALVVRVRVRIDDPNRQLQAGLPAFVTFGSAAETTSR